MQHTVVVLPPTPLHVVLLLQGEGLRRRQLLQLRGLHPLVIPNADYRRERRVMKMKKTLYLGASLR